MVELLADLEKFLEDQRKKLEADKKYLNKATSTPASLLQKNSSSLPSIFNSSHENVKKPQEDAFTQTEDLSKSYLASPKTDDSKLIISMSKTLTETNTTDFPKYGLPGLGEYEEKHKLLVQEQKKELNRYLSQAIKEKESSTKKAPVNYSELLEQKRNEEDQYRELNEGLYTRQHNGSLLPSTDLNSDVAFHKIRSPSARINSAGKKEIDDLTGIFSRIQQYTEMDDFDRTPFLRHSDPLPSIRTTNFRSADNIRSTLFPDVGGLSPRPNTFSNIDRPRELPPNPRVGVIPQANDSNMRRPFEHSQEYRLQLEQQIQEQKSRKQKQLDEERLSQPDPLGGTVFSTTRLNWGTQEYNPWGRAGAGAPMRDLHGNVVTHRRGLNAMNAYNSSLPFYENSAHTLDGLRKVPEKWHDGHWPLPEDKPSRPKVNYQDELRQQIEDKRRREQEERDTQRREEERLTRRMERQRAKIQAEYEAELSKQKLKEEEQRRKTDRLLQIQELERKESQTKRRNHKPDIEWWEREANKQIEFGDRDSPPVSAGRRPKEFTLPKSSTPSPKPMRSNLSSPKSISPPESRSRSPSPEFLENQDDSSFMQPSGERSQSPPIPTLRHRNRMNGSRPTSAVFNDSAPMSPPLIEPNEQSRQSTARRDEINTPVKSRTSTASSVGSNQRRRKGDAKPPLMSPPQEDVLNQLSSMRRQLQLEQQRLQQLMKRDDKYEVFDPRLEGPKVKTSASWRSRRDTSNFDGVELDEIAARNRERKQNLEKLKRGDINGNGTNDNDDSVLENFLKQQS